MPMSNADSPIKPPALKPCPFCGQPLSVRWRKINPKASCETPECWGGKLPVLPLDVPEFVAAWNTRPDEVQAEILSER